MTTPATSPPQPLPATMWLQPCYRCKGPRGKRDIGSSRCEQCRATLKALTRK